MRQVSQRFIDLLQLSPQVDEVWWKETFLLAGDKRVIQHQREVELDIELTLDEDEWREFQELRQECAEEL